MKKIHMILIHLKIRNLHLIPSKSPKEIIMDLLREIAGSYRTDEAFPLLLHDLKIVILYNCLKTVLGMDKNFIDKDIQSLFLKIY